MAIKLYVSLISCSQEVRKNQQRVVMILESKNIPYTVVDITDPCNEDAKEYMVSNAEPSPGSKVPITPQIFNEAEYCGDFNALDMANECDDLGNFLKLSDEEKADIKIGITSLTGATDNVTNGQAQEEEPLETNAAVDNEEITESKPEEPTESTSLPETTEEEGGSFWDENQHDDTQKTVDSQPGGDLEATNETLSEDAPTEEPQNTNVVPTEDSQISDDAPADEGGFWDNEE